MKGHLGALGIISFQLDDNSGDIIALPLVTPSFHIAAATVRSDFV
jgi:hypothetical protein